MYLFVHLLDIASALDFQIKFRFFSISDKNNFRLTRMIGVSNSIKMFYKVITGINPI